MSKNSKSAVALIAMLTCLLGANLAQATLITVPGTAESVEGHSNNGFPFNIGEFELPTKRYQQLYSASQFSSAGVVTEIRFRIDNNMAGDGVTFSTEGIDIRIDFAYSATPFNAPSTIFSDNIGAGLVTVLDTPDLALAGVKDGIPSSFNIIIDVADLFTYDPMQGDFLLDIYMRNSPKTTQFDAINDDNVMSRVHGDLDSGVGRTDSLGLVTQFNFAEAVDVPAPATGLLFSLGLAGLGCSRRRQWRQV